MNEREKNQIRPVIPEDIPKLKQIIEATNMFPPAMLDNMIAGFFSDSQNSDLWLTYDIGVNDRNAKAVVYCRPEDMTDRTWNLLLIAVDPQYQGQGIGRQLMSHIEHHLAMHKQRLLIVETSGTDALADTRSFYRQCHYQEAGRIRDYYEKGDDKVIFQKAMQ
ncbi:MAG: N-acetyltransferase [Parasphingorhabdus sp.]|uniref:GNAT family N-acetyltransferase n=1 Tax=Parasphingorhabdus sp. TaxID=2709688 RepID=UPI003298EDDE